MNTPSSPMPGEAGVACATHETASTATEPSVSVGGWRHTRPRWRMEGAPCGASRGRLHGCLGGGADARSAGGGGSSSGVRVNPGEELDAIVNGDPPDRATTYRLNAQPDGTMATYPISETLRLKGGGRLMGEQGETVTRGPAVYGVPRVTILTQRSLTNE
jgi:hypothetical protein